MLWNLFFIFFRINLLSSSGPASYGLTEQFVVPHVISKHAFQQIVAVSANIPGSDAIQMAWQVGYEAFGLRGALAATTGALMPCILLVTLAMAGMQLIPREITDRFFNGLKPVLFLLLCVTAVNVFTPSRTTDAKTYLILIAGGILLYFKVPVVAIMITAGLVSVIF